MFNRRKISSCCSFLPVYLEIICVLLDMYIYSQNVNKTMDRIKISFNSTGMGKTARGRAREWQWVSESEWEEEEETARIQYLEWSSFFFCISMSLPYQSACFPLFMGFSWVVQCWFLNTLLCVLSSFPARKKKPYRNVCWSMHSHVSQLGV